MCACDKKIKGKLYGIGIGPGDPKLITLKAKEILDKVKTIFVPKAKEDTLSLARSIIENIFLKPKNFIELTFPMTKDKKILRKYWKESARKIAQEIKRNKIAAYLTIGDPFIYSTYIYMIKELKKDFPNIEIETIPGISSFNASAAKAQVPLVEGSEKLAILAVTDNLKELKKILKEFDTVVLMKIGSKLNKVIQLLKDMKLIETSVLISHVGQLNEKIVRDLSSLDNKIGYLSVIIVKHKK